jgi:ABC-type Na+ efflux pump permease subunit
MGDIAGALATWYGYKTIGGLFRENFGLIVILIAFIFVCLVFMRLLNRQFPAGGYGTARAWIFRTVIIFMISAFIFIGGFTIFYEKKKLEESSLVQPPAQIRQS